MDWKWDQLSSGNCDCSYEVGWGIIVIQISAWSEVMVQWEVMDHETHAQGDKVVCVFSSIFLLSYEY